MVRSTDRPAMTIAVDLGRKAKNKQTNIKQLTLTCKMLGVNIFNS